VKSIRQKLVAPIAAALLTACAGGYVVVEGGSPPYHADNGYRHRHPRDHVVLVYNASYAVYAVSGYPNCYYYGGTYYRVSGGVWYASASVVHPRWTVVSYERIPPGLHKKYKHKGYKEKKHKRGHGYD
jgi:hypothetical protein